MGFEGLVLGVLIASPGDTRDARDAVERAIRDWNAGRARASKVVLLPLRWEIDAVSEVADRDGQSVINDQLVDEADIVFGLFYGRLGSPTRRSVSGTAEEIERSILRKANVHVYFSTMALPSDVNLDALAALRDFKRELRERGLLGEYGSIEELVRQVRIALDHDVDLILDARRLIRDSRNMPNSPEAVLRAELVELMDVDVDVASPSAEGKGKARIELYNLGGVAAENVQLSIASVSGGSPPIERFDELEPVAIWPQERMSFPVYPVSGTGDIWNVRISWTESGRNFEIVERLARE